MINRLHSHNHDLCDLSIMVQKELRKQGWINSYWTLKGVKTFFPIFVYEDLVCKLYHVPADNSWKLGMKFLLQDSVRFINNKEPYI